jgi:hypothetical protein
VTISDLGSIANLVAALSVIATLIYLSRQVKQGNVLARSQARQRMVELRGRIKSQDGKTSLGAKGRVLVTDQL